VLPCRVERALTAPPVDTEPVAIACLEVGIVGIVHAQTSATLASLRATIEAELPDAPERFEFCLDDGTALSSVQERTHIVRDYLPTITVRSLSAGKDGAGLGVLELAAWSSDAETRKGSPRVKVMFGTSTLVKDVVRDAAPALGLDPSGDAVSVLDPSGCVIPLVLLASDCAKALGQSGAVLFLSTSGEPCKPLAPFGGMELVRGETAAKLGISPTAVEDEGVKKMHSESDWECRVRLCSEAWRDELLGKGEDADAMGLASLEPDLWLVFCRYSSAVKARGVNHLRMRLSGARAMFRHARLLLDQSTGGAPSPFEVSHAEIEIEFRATMFAERQLFGHAQSSPSLSYGGFIRLLSRLSSRSVLSQSSQAGQQIAACATEPTRTLFAPVAVTKRSLRSTHNRSLAVTGVSEVSPVGHESTVPEYLRSVGRSGTIVPRPLVKASSHAVSVSVRRSVSHVIEAHIAPLSSKWDLSRWTARAVQLYHPEVHLLLERLSGRLLDLARVCGGEGSALAKSSTSAVAPSSTRLSSRPSFAKRFHATADVDDVPPGTDVLGISLELSSASDSGESSAGEELRPVFLEPSSSEDQMDKVGRPEAAVVELDMAGAWRMLFLLGLVSHGKSSKVKGSLLRELFVSSSLTDHEGFPHTPLCLPKQLVAPVRRNWLRGGQIVAYVGRCLLEHLDVVPTAAMPHDVKQLMKRTLIQAASRLARVLHEHSLRVSLTHTGALDTAALFHSALFPGMRSKDSLQTAVHACGIVQSMAASCAAAPSGAGTGGDELRPALDLLAAQVGIREAIHTRRSSLLEEEGESDENEVLSVTSERVEALFSTDQPSTRVEPHSARRVSVRRHAISPASPEAAKLREVAAPLPMALITESISPRQATDALLPPLSPAASPLMMSRVAPARELEEGRMFVKYGRMGRPHRRCVWLELRAPARIVWAHERSGSSRSLPLGPNTKVLAGATTAVFLKHADRVRGRENCCFSVVSSDRTLDLEADSQGVRDAWVARLQFELLPRPSEFD
jgi:hypothetical protein